VKIEKVRKNSQGDITDVMINGNIYSIDDAVRMAKEGMLEGVNVGRARNGREYLRANPDGNEANNLDNLPLF
jgi:tRNA-dihydrouridine synthase